uniref:Uncharacterized protein n=1 Tax=Arion vulgaris TaxID=1028688 RepID=A0A0B6YP23_9EUPU
MMLERLVINSEFPRLQVVTAVIQETHLDSSRNRITNFSGNKKNKRMSREHGIGFVVNESLLGMVETCQKSTERLL